MMMEVALLMQRCRYSSIRQGSGAPMILLAVLTSLLSCFLSCALQHPNQEVKPLGRTLSTVPL